MMQKQIYIVRTSTLTAYGLYGYPAYSSREKKEAFYRALRICDKDRELTLVKKHKHSKRLHMMCGYFIESTGLAKKRWGWTVFTIYTKDRKLLDYPIDNIKSYSWKEFDGRTVFRIR